MTEEATDATKLNAAQPVPPAPKQDDSAPDADQAPIAASSISPLPKAEESARAKRVERVLKSAAPHMTTWGMRVHREFTYRGIDWLLNSTFGVSVSYWGARTKSGRKWFGEPVAGVFRSILKPFFQDAEGVIKNTKGMETGIKWGSMFIGIMAGGTFVNPLITYLENHKHKKSFVQAVDKLVYGKDAVDHNPEFQRAYEAIDNEPKKDTRGVWKSRFIALAPLITVTMWGKTNNKLRIGYKWVGDRTAWMADKVGIKAPKMKANIQENANHEKVSDWDFLHETIGFDFSQTILYSFMHEIIYSWVAKKSQVSRERKEERAETVRHGAPFAKDDAAGQDITPGDALPDKPKPTVKHVAHEQQLAPAPAAQGAQL